MKYVVLQGDGMADEPIAELGGKTPLEYARTPNLDHMAARGILGLTRTIPRGLPPGSDVGTMSILGYDPARYHTGRSPIEAASMGVELGPDDVAFRCNLVTLETPEGGTEVMRDFAGGARPARADRHLALGAGQAPAGADAARALRRRGLGHRRRRPGERPRRARGAQEGRRAGRHRLPRHQLPRQGRVRAARPRGAG